MAAVINYHKCSGLKQHKFIIFLFYVQKSKQGLTGLKKKKNVRRATFFLFFFGDSRENPSFFLPFQLLVSALSESLLQLHWIYLDRTEFTSQNQLVSNLYSIYNLNSALPGNITITRSRDDDVELFGKEGSANQRETVL